MSYKLQDYVWATEFRDPDTGYPMSTAKFVMGYLAYRANPQTDEPVVWPSANTIAAETGLSRRAVFYALRWLLEHGYLEPTMQKHKRATHFRIVVSRLNAVTNPSDQSAPNAPNRVHALHSKSATDARITGKPNTQRSAEASFEVDHTDADRKEHSSTPVELPYPPDPLDSPSTPDTDPVSDADPTHLPAVSSPPYTRRTGRGWTAHEDTPRYGPHGRRVSA